MIPSRTVIQNSSIFVFVIATCMALASNSKSSEPSWSQFPTNTPLIATLTSGRVLRGKLDVRSTASQLWLTIEHDGMTISSMVKAEEVATIVSTETQSLIVFTNVPQDGSERGFLSPTSKEANPFDGRRNSIIGQAQNLAIDAHLDNWDGDANPDGIRLYIVPRGTRGELVTEVGALSVQLSVYRGDIRNTRGRLQEEESWSCEIAKSDYDQFGAVIKLPFRKIQPEKERDIYALGALRVRFKIAGQGVLEATKDDLPIRSRSTTEMLRNRR